VPEPSGFPTIADAKALAVKYRRRGVIVLHFGGGRFGTSSYGMTRVDCGAMKDVSDQIHEAIADGVLVLPDGFSSAEDCGVSAGYGAAQSEAIEELVRLRQRVAMLEALLFRAQTTEASS
jgi:hypothetical protein